MLLSIALIMQIVLPGLMKFENLKAIMHSTVGLCREILVFFRRRKKLIELTVELLADFAIVTL